VSVHAQVEGVGTLEFPDGTDPTVVQATVKKVIAGKGAGGAATGKPKDMSFDLTSAADIAASGISSGFASLAGGVVKAGAAANKALGIDKTLGTDKFDFEHGTEKLEELLTRKPKTDKGKAVMADVAKGLRAFEDWTDKQGAQSTQAILAAGDKASEVAKSLGAPQSVVDFIERHKEQVAAAYGSATKTIINAVPLLLGSELARTGGRVGELARPAEEAPKPATAPPTSATPAPPAADLTLAPSAPRAAPSAAAPPPAAPPLEVAPTSPRGTPNTSLEGAPPPPGPTPPATTPRARAEAYVRDRLGLSWDAVSSATQAKLERVAADARGLDRLNPDAVKRQAKLEGLRVPIETTAGKLNRDNAQLLREQGAAATPSGAPINATDIAANRNLRRNVEVLIDRLRGVGQSRAGALRGERVGEVLAGRGKESPGVLTKLQTQAKARTKVAYEDARKTEPDAKVPPDPMYEFVRGNPEVLNPQIQHLAWLNNWLKKAGIEKLDETGAPTGERRPINAVELDDLRKKAGKMTGGTGDSAHYAKEVLGVIDMMFDEGLPASAAKWKAARQAHAAERGEFKNQGAIDRLVGTKGGNFGTDPKTALEDVWKVSIKNARLEEIRQLKRSLLSGRDAATRLEGKTALRTVRAATAQNLLDQITKNVSTNAKGEPNITAESINNWIKGVGNDGTLEGGIEKLHVVWGRKATRELMDIREAAQITKTEPTVRNVGSNTFQKLLNWMDDSGLGKLVKGVGGGPLVHAAESVVKATENPRTVRAAGETATSQGERAGAKAADQRAAAIQAEQTQRRIPPTYQGGP
jgi:hypothetical protein